MQSTQEAIAELVAAREQYFQSIRSLAEMTKKHWDILKPDMSHEWILHADSVEILLESANALRLYQSRKLKPEFQP